ncbi:MAG: large repetitive protein [Acidobacteriota bacterium]|nr:large repetitive protein [Acidobacteriota bacterium]
MKSFTPTSGVSPSRVFLASLLTCLMLVTPLTPVGFASTTSRLTQTRSKSADKQTPAQKADKPAQGGDAATQKAPPITTSLTAAEISATKTDTIIGDTLGDGKAQAGDTIKYTITVQNNSATETATGVTLNDTVDPNTSIVTNSIHAQPQARNDAYTTVGNTLLKVGVAAGTDPEVRVTGSAFDNDSNATDSNQLASFTQPANGTVTFNADGTFTYLPNANFRGPTDTFTYTLRNSVDNSLTDAATITITITGMVWYVDNSYAGANGTADGRSTRPFTSLTPVNNAASDVDLAGDYIYLFAGNAAYTTGLVLENTQQFIGNGVALVVPINATPTTLRAAGSRPTLSNGTGNALTLANSVTAQGLNLTAAANAALFGSGISGTNNVSDANITTTGSGTAVSLTNQSGTFNYTGGSGSSISGNSTGTAVLVSTGTGNITFSGVPISQNNGRAIDIQTRTGGTVDFSNGSTVTQTAGSTDAVVLRNNTGTSTINFSNNVNLTTSAGRGLVTDNSTGSFTLNMNAAGNNISATGGAAIDVEDIAADLKFVTLSSTNSSAQGIRVFNLSNTPAGRSITVTGTTTVSNSAGTGVLVDSTAAAVTFATLNSAPAVNQIGVNIVSNSGTTSSTGGTVTTTDAPAINIFNSPLAMSLTSVTADNTGDADQCVNMAGMTGTLVMLAGALTGGNAQAFFATGQNGSITYNGTISQANAFRLIEVTNKTGGTVAFGGALTATGANSTGINLATNTGATVNFTGGINLSTGPNAAFTATGGGTVNATQNNTSIVNTLTTTTGTALNVANTNIGASGLTFRSISSNGATNGIVLNTTGAAGGLTVAGNGGTCTSVASCTGGTIQSATNIGVSLNSTTSVSIARMFILNTARSGVEGTNVTNFSYTNGRIENSGTSQTAGSQDANIAFNDQSVGTENNLSGVVTITGNTLLNAFYHGVDIFNFAGTISDAQISDNVITSNTNVANSLGSGIRFVAFGSAGATANITKATLNNNTINNFPSNVGLQVQCGNANTSGTAPATICGTNGSATNIIHITNNKINVPGLGSSVKTGNEGMIALVNGRGQGNFNISSNNIQQNLGTSLSHSAFGLATVTSTINSNTIVANNINAAQGIGVGTSVTAGFATNTPVMTTSINSNNISQVDGNGILAVARDNGNGMLNVTIKNNTVAAPLTGVRQGIRIDAGNSTGDNDVCLDISGNTSAPSVGQPAALGIGLRKQGTSTTVNAFGIEGMAATATPGVETFVNGQNPAGGGTLLISATSGFSNCSSAPTFADDVIVPAYRDAETPASAPPVVNTSAVAQTKAAAQSAFAPVLQNAPGLVSLPQSATAQKAAKLADSSASKETDKEAKTSKTIDIQPLVSTFPINIGTLAPGESVTIVFNVMVNPSIPNNVTTVSNQGTFTGNFGTKMTDDPSVGGANDPTVTDILPRPSYTINNASIPEPSTGSVNMPFTVALSYAYGSPVSVDFATADGTATAAGGDYTPTSGTLNFAAGQTLQTISVPVLGNGDTSDENFTVTLSNPVNSVLGATVTATGTITEASPPGRVLISEVRTSGPNGAGDDFVELYNNQDVAQNISGWALYKSGSSCLATPVLIAVIPAATTIPARGHYLVVGPQYSLTASAAGNATVAAVSDIESDRNIGLFNTSNVLNLSTTTREDAVAFDVNAGGGNNCDLLREGATLLSAGGSASQHSFARNLITGLPKETNDNAADFLLVTTTPAVAVGNNLTPVLGAPGPENLASPTQRNAVVKSSLIDPMVAASAPPNRVRSSFGANPTNAAFGTLSFQRRFKNTLGVPVTRLRFRIVDLTTINNRTAGQSDLRVLSSTGTVTNSAGNTVVVVNGLTLETPPQPNGGGLNSTLSVVLPGGGLAPGNTIDVQFLLGVQEQGAFSFFINVEALPGSGPIPDEATGTTKAGAMGKQRNADATPAGAADDAGQKQPKEQ